MVEHLGGQLDYIFASSNRQNSGVMVGVTRSPYVDGIGTQPTYSRMQADHILHFLAWLFPQLRGHSDKTHGIYQTLLS
jgi:hypothetical protein